MSELLPGPVHDYLDGLARAGEDPILAEMHALAAERRFPIVGPQVGRLLAQLVHLTGAKRIFELGSGFGYSALWFARALPPDGEIFLTDGDPENVKLARGFLDRAGVADRAVFLTGHGQDLLQVAPGLFDIVFCDVDKEQYPEVHGLLRRHLRVGGAFVIDNLLWDGKVTDAAVNDPATRGVRAFTERMWGDPGFLSSLLPLRDGVGLSVRLR